MLLKNQHNPKAVSKLMGHAREIITLDVYADNKNLIQIKEQMFVCIYTKLDICDIIPSLTVNKR